MTTTQYKNDVHEFIVAQEQFNIISRAFGSTLEALETNPKTKKLTGFKRTYVSLGIESAQLNAVYKDLEISIESDGTRKLAAKLGIGAMTQKLLDLIKVIFNRLLGGSGNRSADIVSDILKTLKEIDGVRYTKNQHSRLPEFANKQEEENWNTVWSGYRDRVAEFDYRVKDIDTFDFYAKYTVPRDLEFYRVAGNTVAMSIGIPPCYARGERVKCMHEYLSLVGEARSVIAALRAVEINETKIFGYDNEKVDSFIKKLEDTYQNDWKRVRFNPSKLPTTQEWPKSYSNSDFIVLRNIDSYIKDLKVETERLANRIDLQRRIEEVIGRVPEDERERVGAELRKAAITWSGQVSDLLSRLTSIHISMSSTDRKLDQNLKTFRRTIDLIHRG